METVKIFRPETSSRQGERNAWILTGIALIAEWVTFWRTATFSGWITLLFFFLLLSAIAISFSAWVDRKTILILETGGVKFRNGLRVVQLTWEQIEKVRVIADRWGDRVYVVGTKDTFSFRILSEVELRGKVGGKMGFPEGDTILKEIIHASGLCLTDNKEQDRYYARP
jgi:hypothetical protein